MIACIIKPDQIIYSLDNRYYKFGEIIGTVYQDGKRFKQY